jgi:hypothetical protein
MSSTLSMAAVVILAACATQASEPPSDGKTNGDGTAVAYPAPQLVSFHGAAAISALKLYTVMWQVDADLGPRVQAFQEWLLTSGHWGRLTQYGVGPGTHEGLIVVPDAPPSAWDDNAIDGMINGWVGSGAIPAVDADTAFTFLVPQSTTVPPGTGGYHTATPNGVEYTVNTQYLQSDGSYDWNWLTFELSHEQAELATDPQKNNPQFGWYNDDVWFGEVGDLCNQLRAQIPASTETYTVQRYYSNAKAKAGLDPCEPYPSGESYRVVAAQPAVLQVGSSDSVVMTLEAYSADANPLAWSAWFINQPVGVTFSPQSGSILPGQTAALTFTAANAPPTDLAGGLILETDDASGTPIGEWTGQLSVVASATQ